MLILCFLEFESLAILFFHVLLFVPVALVARCRSSSSSLYHKYLSLAPLEALYVFRALVFCSLVLLSCVY
jgi:hypothetical protein